MRELIDDVLQIDWEQVRIRRAVSGLVSMLLVVAFIDAIGDPVVAAMLATLFTTAAGGDGTMSQRLPGMVRFTIVGAAIGGLAYWSTESALTVAIVMGAATYLGTLAAIKGPAAAKAGLYLTIWPLFALLMGSRDTEPWTVAAGFLVGGSVAIAITAIRLRVSSEDEAGEHYPPEEMLSAKDSSWIGKVGAAMVSPIGVFALLRTFAVVVAVVLGATFFSSYPLWVAITVIVVVKPTSSQSFSTAVQRTLGTAAGVAIATVVSSVLPTTDLAVALAFLSAGVLMVAFNNANYTLFATFLTAMLVFGQRLAQEDALEAGWQRLLATLVGAGIAIVVMYVSNAVTPQRPEPGAPHQNRTLSSD